MSLQHVPGFKIISYKNEGKKCVRKEDEDYRLKKGEKVIHRVSWGSYSSLAYAAFCLFKKGVEWGRANANISIENEK